ncbi:hypothetical protein JHJ32_12885 [Parapedobacter sp. ISTM3]|uniref:carbohydrate-binding family 9-like protein n=1 Tax=Parapedobacter sp. ISTM3 TaxID=2800130 RepID=UPI00190488DB|nr:carbohydrate-binding family 9-like protein [Parapedobacter sp. ISTM3]MBK1440888.1 hypothetical protein [Parapedobacter sp. ISTM3]
MKRLIVPFIPVAGVPSPREVMPLLETVQKTPIDVNPWPHFVHDVEANVTIAHNGNAIFLKYDIVEAHVTARATTNGAVHQDSCVEFFVSFDGILYYNLEFNCLGWCKAAYGVMGPARKLLPEHTVNLIASATTMDVASVGNKKRFAWQIVLAIPAALFCYHNISSFKRVKAIGNFYKCGDGLPTVHYLSWNPIWFETPNFHRIEDFGQIEFGA